MTGSHGWQGRDRDDGRGRNRYDGGSRDGDRPGGDGRSQLGHWGRGQGRYDGRDRGEGRWDSGRQDQGGYDDRDRGRGRYDGGGRSQDRYNGERWDQGRGRPGHYDGTGHGDGHWGRGWDRNEGRDRGRYDGNSRDGDRPGGDGRSQLGHGGRGRGRYDSRDRGRTPSGRAPGRPGEPDTPRLLALRALERVRQDDAYANLVLPPMLDQARAGRRDAAFTTSLTYGTLRLQGRYDAVIAMCSNRPLDQVDALVLDVLRLGVHQLLGMRVPTHAAVSTTVDLASYAAGRGAATFVNAVLRKVAQGDLESWLERVASAAPDEVSALARTHSHPAWVVRAMRQALLGNERDVGELQALLEADNTEPEVALCARPGLVTPEELASAAWDASHQGPRRGERSPYAVVLAGGDPVRIAAVRDSRAGVEDEGSQLVALVLSEAPLQGRDERWLDLCAGPGGKAALLGARAAQRGATLVANEVAPHRCDLVRTAVRALPERVVEVRCADGREAGRQEPGAYDRVLVDVPCSGLGSLRRRPEARWRRQPRDVTELAALQRDLLASALLAARPGGVVAYTTCSPHLLETSLVVKDTLAALARKGVEASPLHAGEVAARVSPVPPAGAEQQMLQLWPHLDGTDAMFCALLCRH